VNINQSYGNAVLKVKGGNMDPEIETLSDDPPPPGLPTEEAIPGAGGRGAGESGNREKDLRVTTPDSPGGGKDGNLK
jgi:hypothetical protein